MSNENNLTTPNWVKIYLWVTAILSLLLAVLAFAMPVIQFPALEQYFDTQAFSLSGPVGLYISRNIAAAGMTIFALLKKSYPMILMAVVLRIFTDSFDFLNNLIEGNVVFAVIAFVMVNIAVVGFRHMRKK